MHGLQTQDDNQRDVSGGFAGQGESDWRSQLPDVEEASSPDDLGDLHGNPTPFWKCNNAVGIVIANITPHQVGAAEREVA